MTNLLVVSDSSSLILATKAGLLEVVCKEFTVEIPETVFEETVIAGKKLQKTDAFKIEEAIQENKILVKKVKPRKEKKEEQWFKEFNIDKGEEEAIKLYIQTKADLLLVDDKQAINTARLLEINWVTVPTLIVEFTKKQKITKKQALESLRTVQEEGRYKLDFILEAMNEIEKING
ncbi:MAG: hypothetical protein ABH821_00660 [archaeon]